MPRKAKPPRLWLRPGRADRGAAWVILCKGREVATGCSAADVAGAEQALARHITASYQIPQPTGRLAETHILDVIIVYAREQAPKHEDGGAWVGKMLEPICEWWADKTLADIKARTCREYVAWRTAQPRKHSREGLVSDQTARSELKMLRAAIGYFHANYGPLSAVPVVTLPSQAPQRQDYWLTRKQVADRIRAARKLPKCGHVIRALLIGVYTGTRPGAVLKLRWIPSTSGGWFDLDSETLHRRARGKAESRKRQTVARIHRRLLPWLRIWRAADMERGVLQRVNTVNGRRVVQRVTSTFVVHYGGRQIIKGLEVAWRRVAGEAGHARKNKQGRWIAPDGPHICRHTAATWLMQSGVKTSEVAGYLGMSEQTLVDVYGHHHPDFQTDAASATGKRKTATPMKRP